LAAIKDVEELIPHLRILIYTFREACRILETDLTADRLEWRQYLLENSPFDELHTLAAYVIKWFEAANQFLKNWKHASWLQKEVVSVMRHKQELEHMRTRLQTLVRDPGLCKTGTSRRIWQFRPSRDHSRCLHGTSLQRKKECEALSGHRRRVWCGRWLDMTKASSVAARRGYIIQRRAGKTYGLFGLIRSKRIPQHSTLSATYAEDGSGDEFSWEDASVTDSERSDMEWLKDSVGRLSVDIGSNGETNVGS
jgi:hypothetical protein